MRLGHIAYHSMTGSNHQDYFQSFQVQTSQTMFLTVQVVQQDAMFQCQMYNKVKEVGNLCYQSNDPKSCLLDQT